MPLRETEDLGTNADGSKTEEYCFHCFMNGVFLDAGITLQGKIEKNVQFGTAMGMSEDAARRMCETILPTLKRWRSE